MMKDRSSVLCVVLYLSIVLDPLYDLFHGLTQNLFHLVIEFHF